MFMSAKSPRTVKNGVNIWPHWSMTVRFQVHSVEARVYSPGTPGRRRLLALIRAGSAVVGVHKLLVRANCEIGSKLTASRERLITLLWKLRSPPKIGLLKT